MTDMDAVRFTRESNALANNVKYDEKLLLKGSKAGEFNPFVTNKVFMILFGDQKRI